LVPHIVSNPPMSGYLSPLNLNKEVRHETKI
jgi:hypothetical protein